MAFSSARTAALCKKEILQIVRDPSSLLIAVVIPFMLLFIFGYGISLDSNKIRIGVLTEDHSAAADKFFRVLDGSPYIIPVPAVSRNELQEKMTAGDIRGIIVIPEDFARESAAGAAKILVVTDGSEPNVANFIRGYMQGIAQTALQQQAQDIAYPITEGIRIEQLVRFNSAAVSRNFIIPGAIAIIMTVIGSILTSLVIAREWERGTMEALLSTPMTKYELLLSKLLPYYLVGIIAFVICFGITVLVFKVPFRGSFAVLFSISSLFLLTVLGMGLLISTLTRNQFDAAMITLNAAFLPAVMLSGFVFEINSMPAVIQIFSYVIPARYYVTAMQTLFLAGDIVPVLAVNAGFLLVFMLLLLSATVRKTKLDLE